MDEELCKQVDQIMSEFLWLGKRPKISKNILQSSKRKGGVRLFDIRRKQKTLKIMWVKRLQTNVFFKECFKISFPCFNCICINQFEKIWTLNIKKSDVKKLSVKDTDIFWQEVLECWCEINYTENPESVKEI